MSNVSISPPLMLPLKEGEQIVLGKNLVGDKKNTLCLYLACCLATLYPSTRDSMSDTVDTTTTILPDTNKSTTSNPSSPTKPTQSSSTHSCNSFKNNVPILRKISKQLTKQRAIKKAEKADRIARKANEKLLLEWCEKFTRVYHMEGRHRFSCDEFGVMVFSDADGDIACPVSVMQFLIDKKQLHATEGDSATKSFYESEYDLISNFPEHLDRFAAVIQTGAKLARAAKIGDVKAGDYNEDDSDNDDSEDDE
jgi:uncharacterized Zn finger protein (UPF0148 family)